MMTQIMGCQFMKERANPKTSERYDAAHVKARRYPSSHEANMLLQVRGVHPQDHLPKTRHENQSRLGAGGLDATGARNDSSDVTWQRVPCWTGSKFTCYNFHTIVSGPMLMARIILKLVKHFSYCASCFQ
jgi:hypothetical protein